ncbi:MAG: alpha/beta fold hydrolase [Flavobacteriaceae bacterium]|nr:alpha/beta fold hydrolase [Flavobacteriaceae bacterium]
MLLHSQILGEGVPFVILHGFLGSGDNWKSLGIQWAAQGYQVHLVDQRNHGRSFHSDIFTYEAMGEDLKAYCNHFNLENIVLLGHSMGGKTAMEFATTYPEKVSKLIVADIAPKAYPPHHQDILKGLSSLNFDKITSREEADRELSNYIPQWGVRQFLLKNLYWIEKGKLALRINLPILIEKYDTVGNTLTEEALFEKETLFLKGEKSGYIDAMDEILIKKHFPSSKIETISKAGHWLHAENPKEFYEKTLSFIEN